MLVTLWGQKVKIHHLQNINLVSFSHNKPKLLNTVNKTKTKTKKQKKGKTSCPEDSLSSQISTDVIHLQNKID